MIFNRYPKTLLGSGDLDKHYDPHYGDYFFDTNQEAFESIFDFYLYGKLYQPASIPSEMFEVNKEGVLNWMLHYIVTLSLSCLSILNTLTRLSAYHEDCDRSNMSSGFVRIFPDGVCD